MLAEREPETWPAPPPAAACAEVSCSDGPEYASKYYRARYYDPKIGRFLSEDPIGFTASPNFYAYVGGNPTSRIDPDGLDAIRITYPNYPVDIGNGTTLRLGHGAVIAVDPNTGITKYYEYGRYDSDFGQVKGPSPDREVPNLVMGKDGNPTQESLSYLYDHISNKYGKGTPVEATYWKDADFQRVLDFAERRKRDPKRRPYSWSLFNPNHCQTFADEAIRAGRQRP